MECYCWCITIVIICITFFIIEEFIRNNSFPLCIKCVIGFVCNSCCFLNLISAGRCCKPAFECNSVSNSTLGWSWKSSICWIVGYLFCCGFLLLSTVQSEVDGIVPPLASTVTVILFLCKKKGFARASRGYLSVYVICVRLVNPRIARFCWQINCRAANCLWSFNFG